MPRIEELRKPVRPIAKKFRSLGFKIVDLASVGIWMIRDWDANELSKHIENLEKLVDIDQNVQGASEERVSMTNKKSRRRKSSKSG